MVVSISQQDTSTLPAILSEPRTFTVQCDSWWVWQCRSSGYSPFGHRTQRRSFSSRLFISSPGRFTFLVGVRQLFPHLQLASARKDAADSASLFSHAFVTRSTPVTVQAGNPALVVFARYSIDVGMLPACCMGSSNQFSAHPFQGCASNPPTRASLQNIDFCQESSGLSVPSDRTWGRPHCPGSVL